MGVGETADGRRGLELGRTLFFTYSSLECGPVLSSLLFKALNPLESLYAPDVFQLLHFLF